jgi:hypothetical protein
MSNHLLRKLLLSFLVLFAITASLCAAPRLPEKDRIRLAETYRFADSLGNNLWKDWNTIPFPILLITTDTEFLLRHPSPDTSFTKSGYDSLLKTEIYARPRVFPPNLLASFPFDGVPTTVIGEAENTESKTSTPWMITLLHEHFHQLQDAQPGYFDQVKALNLSGGDMTGMWMLNYPFPYDSASVQAGFDKLKVALGDAVTAPDSSFAAKFADYCKIRRDFMSSLREPDRKYMSFQLWQEGVARYTELRVAQWGETHYTPSEAFQKLEDYAPIANTANLQFQILQRACYKIPLGGLQRMSFYIIGCAEAYIINRADPVWMNRYFSPMLTLDHFFK